MLPYIYYLYLSDVKEKRKSGVPHLFGIYGYFGLPGRGKTMMMCYELKRLRKKYGDSIYIVTNFNYFDEDSSFTGWEMLLINYDKPLVVAWDEVQNEFNSRAFKSFPIQLLTQLTQVRKGNGIQILYTSQKWHFVDKNFRSLSFGCYECHCILGRFTTAAMYDADDYEQITSTVDVSQRHRIHPKKRVTFIQSDDLRNCYDSYKMLQTAKSKEYMDRTEITSIATGRLLDA